jgi:cobaltochelatase CobN
MVYQPLEAPAMARRRPAALLVFYRAHLQAGNTAVFDAMLAALT